MEIVKTNFRGLKIYKKKTLKIKEVIQENYLSII